MGEPERGSPGELAVRDEYDSAGQKYVAIFDPDRPDAWIRVPYLQNSRPDFSDPRTWERLREEESSDDRSQIR